MSTYVGGARQRLIDDSLYHLIRDHLATLGWFNTTIYDLPTPGTRQHHPVTFVTEPIKHEEPIQLNTIALTDGNTDDHEAELGSNLGEERSIMYVDVFAENKAIGKSIAYDIRDILAGRFASLGLTSPTLHAYDYHMATPSVIFTCDIENIKVDRAQDFPHPWLQNWYAVRCEIVDYYESDS